MLRKWLNSLYQRRPFPAEGRSPRLMTPDNLGERHFHGEPVESAIAVHRDRFVIKLNLCRILRVKPNLLLSVGNWGFGPFRTADDPSLRRHGGCAAAQKLLQ